MLPEYKTKTNIGVGLGLIGQILGRVLMDSTSQGLVLLGALVAIAGAVVFIWGCAQYAKAKGHSGWFGLFGLLWLLGLLVLFFLPDRHKAVRA
ncbi:MAG: hypothetical protein ACREPZ_00475 [Rhodanobacteraceae bacterium]